MQLVRRTACLLCALSLTRPLILSTLHSQHRRTFSLAPRLSIFLLTPVHVSIKSQLSSRIRDVVFLVKWANTTKSLAKKNIRHVHDITTTSLLHAVHGCFRKQTGASYQEWPVLLAEQLVYRWRQKAGAPSAGGGISAGAGGVDGSSGSSTTVIESRLQND